MDYPRSAVNPVTGDLILSKSSELYRNNYDSIFKKPSDKDIIYWSNGDWCYRNELEEYGANKTLLYATLKEGTKAYVEFLVDVQQEAEDA